MWKIDEFEPFQYVIPKLVNLSINVQVSHFENFYIVYKCVTVEVVIFWRYKRVYHCSSITYWIFFLQVSHIEKKFSEYHILENIFLQVSHIQTLFFRYHILKNFTFGLLISSLPTRRTSRDVRRDVRRVGNELINKSQSPRPRLVLDTPRVGNELINKNESPRPRLVLDTPPHPIMLYRSYCTSTRDDAGYFCDCACVARMWAAAVRALGECGFEPVTLVYSPLMIRCSPSW